MSERRDRLVALRKRLIMGDPAYEIDPVLGNKKRPWGTKPGIEELTEIGDYAPGAASLRMTMETLRDLIDDMLDRVK